MLRKFKYFMWLNWKRATRHPLVSILLLLAFSYLACVAVVMRSERVGFGEATSMILPSFMGNLGPIHGNSLVVQTAVVAGLAVGITFIAILTAKITSSFMEFMARGGIMRKKIDFSEHILICGWNYQGERVISELLSPNQKQHVQIAILADDDRCPVSDLRVEFMKGDPTQDRDLLRAGVMRANSVIILTDFTKGPNEADAEALMVVLAIKSLNRRVHTCVQLVNSANRSHLQRALADEIICLDQLGGNLAVASALNHGLSHILSDLLTFEIGSEFYRIDGHMSSQLVGKEFAEAVQTLVQRRVILLAVETDYSDELCRQLGGDCLHALPREGRLLVINPQSEYRIRPGDALFVIAESRPTDQ